eukprot:598694-Pyramimonas_sp.AAC.1
MRFCFNASGSCSENAVLALRTDLGPKIGSRARAAKSVAAKIDLREGVFVLPERSPLTVSRAAPHSGKLFFSFQEGRCSSRGVSSCRPVFD